MLGTLLLVLSACSTTVTRVPIEQPIDLSGRWNDTDSRLTAEAMIKEALDRPWAQRFLQSSGRGPTVIVGTVLNRTHDHLNTQTFVKDLERALLNSGQVQFVADAGQRQEIRQERLDQAQHARTETVKPMGQESGADFILQGTINSLVDELESTKAIFYQVDLELIDLASNVKVWLGQKKVKKLVERSKTTL
ncbi:MAG: penicillin-binding protein activator LpoB [Candidatus Tectomicrobia bacterium]|uniref:Penicillin-binding protein activator LpoB n=1 Tax=Tectimicrobiota bacterium TaxID=2528274 RepID=A0A937W583_UNCTE|nr:penicillin-binding protein activator LpoB [Candidatus Tectomicrobia bacterium]